ncbi:MAG TPA: HlyD family efflux transporter periplasmic adaptor subunit [Tepidisphaeraceae bacterium]|nr:HlyD family efflux transporter periplasmic adaptor subunit [Tepidisphaeraceae bacterium]
MPLAILAIAGGLLAYAARDALWPGVEVRVVPVVVRAGGGGTATSAAAPAAHGGSRSGDVVAQAPGWVEPDPYALAASALTDGVVAEVLVLEGEPVTKGQVVARLIADDAKLALDRAAAELASRQAALSAAQETWDNPVERERAVAAAQALHDEAAADLTRLPLDLDAERARFKELAFEHESTAGIQTGAVSRVEAVRAKQRMDAQAALIRSLEAKRGMLEAKVRQHAAELAAAKEHRRLRTEETRALADAKAAVRLAEAGVAEAKLRLERTEVKSPADGVVMRRMVEPGSKVVFGGDVAQSAQVVRLYDPRRLQVRVDVPLADAAKVGVGQAARVTVDVLPDRVFDGVVTRAGHEADVQKNTQQFKVSIKDPATEIKPEMLAKVRFLGGARPTPGTTKGGGNIVNSSAPNESAAGSGGTVFAPESLVRQDGDVRWAMVLDSRAGRAVRRTVTLGSDRRDGWVAIATGLNPGDRLIVSDRPVSDGQRVRVIGEADDDQFRDPKVNGGAKGGHHGAH